MDKKQLRLINTLQAAYIADLEDALAAAPQSAEPVAWQWRHKESNEWHPGSQEFVEHRLPPDFVGRALYAAPPTKKEQP